MHNPLPLPVWMWYHSYATHNITINNLTMFFAWAGGKLRLPINGRDILIFSLRDETSRSSPSFYAIDSVCYRKWLYSSLMLFHWSLLLLLWSMPSHTFAIFDHRFWRPIGERWYRGNDALMNVGKQMDIWITQQYTGYQWTHMCYMPMASVRNFMWYCPFLIASSFI